MNTTIEAYEAGRTTLEIIVAGHTFTAQVPAMLDPGNQQEFLVDGEVLADFELRIAQWWCDRPELPGAALKFIRHTLGLKQVELAELLGYKAETLSRWETGEREVPRLVRVVLAGVVADRLAGQEETLHRLRGTSPRGANDPRRIELGSFDLRRPGAVLVPVDEESSLPGI